MKLMRVLAAVTFAALALPAAAATLNDTDSAYLKTAIQIQSGRYAMAQYEAQHGSGKAKAFAQRVASQSASDSRMLESLAKRYGVTPDKGLLIEDRYHYGQLVGLSGSSLDKTFARELRISDQINQDTEKHQMQHGSDAALKAYAKRRYAAIQSEIKSLKAL
jgi:hypothetical protein